MSEEEETREQIDEIIKEDEIVNENSQEEAIEEVKPKAKVKATAEPKAKVTIIKEPVEPVIEPIEAEPVVEDKPQKIDKLKETVKCPDCNVSMSQHTLKYIHKKGDIVKQLLKKQSKHLKGVALNQNRKSQHHHLDYKSNQHQ